MTKLGIGDLIRSASIALWRGGWPMLVCLTLWVGVECAIQQLQWRINPFNWMLRAGPEIEAAASSPSDTGTLLQWAYFANALIGDVARCTFIAAMLRIILLGRAGPWNLGRNGMLRACGGVLLVSFAFTAIRMVPFRLFNALFEPLLGDIRGGSIEVGLALLIGLTLLYLAIRLCLLYPSMAVGRGWGIARSWRSTAGNGVRLTVLAIGVLFGHLIASGIFDVLLVQLIVVSEADGLLGVGWPYMIKGAGTRVVLTTIFLALSAVAFARLTEYPATRIPGSSKSPEQLAEAFD